MFKVVRVKPNRLEISVDKRLSGKSVDQLVREFISQSESMQNGKIIFRISDVKMPSIVSMVSEVFKLPEIIRAANRYRKVAVITDSVWLRRLAAVKGMVLPGILVKSFRPDEETAAQAWLVGFS